ncbi:MAG: hypothetical protein ACKER6_00655 [Candidatus Hodgkinia cicadicola]
MSPWAHPFWTKRANTSAVPCASLYMPKATYLTPLILRRRRHSLSNAKPSGRPTRRGHVLRESEATAKHIRRSSWLGAF